MTEIDRNILPLDEDRLLSRPSARSGLNLDPIAAPEHAPNVVIVLIDDMGFGATSAFGGPCKTPTAERLAANGLKYTRFHTTALCSPTRQALLTGRNHHAVNMGNIIEMATPVRGYSSVRPNSASPLAEVLRLNGYNTAAFGKWHQTPAWEAVVEPQPADFRSAGGCSDTRRYGSARDLPGERRACYRASDCGRWWRDTVMHRKFAHRTGIRIEETVRFK